MSQTCSPSTQRRYGLARVRRVWEVARSTLYPNQAHERARGDLPEARPQDALE